MKERELQEAVFELAARLRWLGYHTFDSRHSQAGFPDVVLVRPPRLLFAELKDAKNKPTVAQEQWLDQLGSIDEQIEWLWGIAEFEGAADASDTRPAVEAYLWRPVCWTSGEIERILR